MASTKAKIRLQALIARFMGQHGAHLGPTGPRWAPCWTHELCYRGGSSICGCDPNEKLLETKNSIEIIDAWFITMTVLWARWCLKSLACRLFAQPFVQVQITENIKTPRHRPLWWQSGGFPSQRASNAENVSIWWRHHDWWKTHSRHPHLTTNSSKHW